MPAPQDPCRRRLLTLSTTSKAVDSSPWTVRRWSRDPRTGFPQPRVINNRLFWFEDELIAWLETRPLETKAPPIFQTKRNGADREGDTLK
jgi:hypothetical protein